VHKEFVPPGQTVDGNFYCEVLRRLRENVGHKWPEMWKIGCCTCTHLAREGILDKK